MKNLLILCKEDNYPNISSQFTLFTSKFIAKSWSNPKFIAKIKPIKLFINQLCRANILF